MTTYAVGGVWHGTDAALPAEAWCGVLIPADAEQWVQGARTRATCDVCKQHDLDDALALAEQMAPTMRAVAAPCGHLLGTIPDGPLGSHTRTDLLRRGPVGSRVINPTGRQVYGLLVLNEKCDRCDTAGRKAS